MREQGTHESFRFARRDAQLTGQRRGRKGALESDPQSFSDQMLHALIGASQYFWRPMLASNNSSWSFMLNIYKGYPQPRGRDRCQARGVGAQKRKRLRAVRQASTCLLYTSDAADE